ncbi:MAG: pentapeptide repeat-containing protein [Acidobacteria bacterium]|nr:pentapeptide repeat-containing protein [Acidobacteriota bacterium]
MTQPLTKGEILHRLASGDSLRGSNLVRADLAGMDLSRVDLSQSNLRMTNLTHANLSDARLSNSFLSGATLNSSTLVGANLVEASLIGAMLKGVDLSRADLSGADLTGTTLENSILSGAYLVGAFLTEADLTGANLTSAYVRMAQLAGSNLTEANFENADLSYSDLSGARLEGTYLVGANLTGAKLCAGSLTGCDLRNANLTNADLSGCNLTGAKLHGVIYDNIKLADAWADWIDVSNDGVIPLQGSIEEVFIGILTHPFAQVFIEGNVPDHVWSVILAHLCEFQINHTSHADIQLKGIHKGISSSALYLEAESEASLVAYFAELAEIAGKGSQQLLEKLSVVNVSKNGHKPFSKEAALNASTANGAGALSVTSFPLLDDPLGLDFSLSSHADTLQKTAFWNSEKGFAILTGTRQVYLQAVSNESLTLRPPHNATAGLDLIRGHFVKDNSSHA